ncbi:MAG TPA: pepsin/retropepsin-like aspartic protease family protein [Thermoanaerobaculia bacterium]|nr:pepsin/retropepsin-like aspartic protease family protein [Thermoanaerobaculia bacterium]
MRAAGASLRRSTVARAAVVAVSAAVAVGIAALAANRGPEPTHEIAFDFRTHQPIIPVRVGGGEPVPFVFDTGASIHVIDEEIARRAGVTGGSERTMFGGGLAAARSRWVDGLTLRAGGLEWKGQRAAIVDLGYPKRKHFAGMFGAPILMRYTVQFHFERRVMRLIDPAAYTPPAKATRVNFELDEDLPIVRALVDAGNGPIEARLMVDTGAGADVDLNRPFVDAHGLLAAMPNAKPVDRPAGIGGTSPFLYATGKSVTLGGLVFERPLIGLSRATSGSSSRSERDGVLGNDLLRRFVVTFDYRRRTLVLDPL